MWIDFSKAQTMFVYVVLLSKFSFDCTWVGIWIFPVARASFSSTKIFPKFISFLKSLGVFCRSLRVFDILSLSYSFIHIACVIFFQIGTRSGLRQLRLSQKRRRWVGSIIFIKKIFVIVFISRNSRLTGKIFDNFFATCGILLSYFFDLPVFVNLCASLRQEWWIKNRLLVLSRTEACRPGLSSIGLLRNSYWRNIFHVTSPDRVRRGVCWGRLVRGFWPVFRVARLATVLLSDLV